MRTYSFLGSSTAFCPCRCRSRCCFLKENERISMVLNVQMSSRGQRWACAGRWPRGSGFIGYYIGNGHEQHAVHFSLSATWSGAERQLVQAGERNGNMRTHTQTKGQGSVLMGGRGWWDSCCHDNRWRGRRVEAGGGVISETALLIVHLQCTALATPQEASRKSGDSTGIKQLVLSADSKTRLF